MRGLEGGWRRPGAWAAFCIKVKFLSAVKRVRAIGEKVWRELHRFRSSSVEKDGRIDGESDSLAGTEMGISVERSR